MRLTIFLSLLAVSASAAVTVAPLFSDHAVLQRNRPVPVWGRADPAEKIKATFQGQAVATVADAQGRWVVTFPPLATAKDGADLVIEGENTVTLHDVVVGEVWLCSGQSNMGFDLSRAANAATEIPLSANPLLREIIINDSAQAAPSETAKASKWEIAGPQTSGRFTAVGYFFGKELAQKIGVPVGLIKSTVGGTPVEAWMSAEAFASDSAFAGIAERSRAEDRSFADLRLKAWRQAEAGAMTSGAEAHAAFLKATPAPAVYPPKLPMVLFNGKIAPLKPYAFRGVIWYQGEANAARPREYHRLFAAMITDWRRYFAQGDFPFYWVQLPNFAAGDPAGTKWAELREAQTQTLSLPNTGQALAIDVGDAKNLHPTNKVPVGHRLALIAARDVYGFKDEANGPAFRSAERAGREFTITFEHAAGLNAHGGEVLAVEMSGPDRVFHPAQARIVGDRLVVSSTAVAEPVAVRYAWTNAPDAKLYNGAGLPAVPFRSDSW